MSFLSAFLKQCNQYQIVIPAGQYSGNVTLAHGEDLNYSTIDILGTNANDGLGAGGAGATAGDSMLMVEVASPTVVQASRNGNEGQAVLRFAVNEFYPALMHQPVQRGMITFAGQFTTDSAAYNPTSPKAQVRYLGMRDGASGYVGGNGQFGTMVYKKDNQHATAQRLGFTGFGHYVSFEVVDWR